MVWRCAAAACGLLGRAVTKRRSRGTPRAAHSDVDTREHTAETAPPRNGQLSSQAHLTSISDNGHQERGHPLDTEATASTSYASGEAVTSSSPHLPRRISPTADSPARHSAEREASLRERGHTLFSKGELLLLWTPQIILHADGSLESQRAFETLAKAGLRFQVQPLPPDGRLYATWYDFTFNGLDAVRDMARRLREFGETFNASFEQQMPASHQRTDPKVTQFMADLRAFQLEEAQSILAGLRLPAR